MQAGDSHFEQISDKSVAKSWQLPAVMGHSLANQQWLVTVSTLYQLYVYENVSVNTYYHYHSLFVSKK